MVFASSFVISWFHDGGQLLDRTGEAAAIVAMIRVKMICNPEAIVVLVGNRGVVELYVDIVRNRNVLDNAILQQRRATRFLTIESEKTRKILSDPDQ